MKRQNGQWAPVESDDRPETERQQRRIGRIVHDERGSATVEWREAPANYERQKFELESGDGSSRGDYKLRRGLEPTLEICNDDTFNPYERKGSTFSGRGSAPAAPGKGGKRDLRKLSEWMKMMRAMEERKKNGD